MVRVRPEGGSRYGEPVSSANLAFRFVLEIASLIALAYGGWRLGSGISGQLLLALGAPLTFVAIWGVFISPKAPRRIADPVRLGLEVLLFAGVTIMIAASSFPLVAAAFAIAVAANLAAMATWGQRGH